MTPRRDSKSKKNKDKLDKVLLAPKSRKDSKSFKKNNKEETAKVKSSSCDEKEEEERDFKRNNDVDENTKVDLLPSTVSTDTELTNDESNIEELKKQINEIKMKLASRYGEISDDEEEEEEEDSYQRREIAAKEIKTKNREEQAEPVDEEEEMKNDYGETVLHLAIKEGDFRKVKTICEEEPLLANIKGYQDNTVLHYAASNEQLLCLQILSQFGSVDEVNDNSETILHAAARTGSTKCVRWICDNYPELVNVKGPSGNTPLHYATIYDKFSCLIILLRYSDIFIKNDEGHTAHDIANQKVDEENETDQE